MAGPPGKAGRTTPDRRNRMKKSIVRFALAASLLAFHTGTFAAGLELGREDMGEFDATLIVVDLIAVRPLS